MIFGNPYQFAILVEPIPEWSDQTFINGLTFYIVDGLMLPFHENGYVCNTTINSDLFEFKNHLTAWKNNPQNYEIFTMPKEEAFEQLLLKIWPNEVEENIDIPENFTESYEYYLTPTMMQDSGYYCFLVGSGDKSRILVSRWSTLVETEDGERVWKRIEKPYVKEVFIEHSDVVQIFTTMLKTYLP